MNKKQMQIRRAILAFEKKCNIYAPSYLGNAEHQKSMDGKELETKNFKLRVRYAVPSDYHSGGYVFYDVHDKTNDMDYTVIHYFPNIYFHNSYGWEIQEA
jgi:hypothetical protein